MPDATNSRPQPATRSGSAPVVASEPLTPVKEPSEKGRASASPSPSPSPPPDEPSEPVGLPTEGSQSRRLTELAQHYRITTVIVQIGLKSQNEDLLKSFEEAVVKAPSVVSCHLMSGEDAYLVTVMARDLADFVRGDERLAKRPQAEQRHLTDPGEAGEDGGAEAVDHGPTVLQRSGQKRLRCG